MSKKKFDFTHFPIIETSRLILREVIPEDVNALLKHFGNPEVVKFIDMQPIRTIEQANEWLKWMGGFFAAHDGLRWGVIRKEDEQFVGSAGIHRWNREANYAEIGFDVASPYWNQGYATEVAHALVQFGWDYMKLNRVEADVVHGNFASMRVLEKIAFRKEGTLRQRVLKGGKYYDVNLYGLLRHEYQRAHPNPPHVLVRHIERQT